jgi:uncharacterized protein (TIGR02646 family)
MIRVDRYRVPPPEIFKRQGPAQKERELAQHFFSETDPMVRQRRFDFKIYRHRSVKEALVQLFYGKCAYCEVKVGISAPIDVELFRPKASVVESPDHPGYWWLAMVWENLLSSCADCNRVRLQEGVRTGKANRFPLMDETKRAFTPDADISKEEPLLLDPCNDHPEEHLVFDETGRVVSDTDRGNVTIAVVGLNRPFLVEARRLAAVSVAQHFKVLERLSDDQSRHEQLEAIKSLTLPQEEFAGLKRQLVASFLSKSEKSVKEKRAFSKSKKELDAVTVEVSDERHERAIQTHQKYEHDQSTYSLDDEQGREKFRGQRRMIERIEIKDVKAIQSLVLDFTQVSGRTPWLMLLGENATGKSTVLQVASLALLGARAFVNLARTRAIHPAEFVRYNSKIGSVSVKVSGFPQPHKLVFRSDRVQFKSPTGEKTTIVFKKGEAVIKGKDWAPQMLLLGYGATKLLPRGSSSEGKPSSDDGFCRVDNLFDPFVPLIDAEKWLVNLDDARFNDTARILKDLMALSDDAELVKDSGRVLVVAHGSRVPLKQLSDGYQSVVAMTVDILEVAHRLWPKLEEAEAIVLLDEVGAHLHPTWKMKIVGSLRKALPAMQFVATTHDPLCLRGMEKGEVAVMQRGEDSQVTALTGLPSPGDFRIDQLLTSDFFGLNSLEDPEVEALFDEYYALLGMSSLDEDQKKRLSQLREDLKGRRHFGTTKRESLMYEAVDRLMAQHRKQPTIPIADLKESAVEEVAKIWKAAVGGGDGAQ